MARTVTPAPNAVVTEIEAQQFVFKDTSTGAHTDEELDVLCRIINGVSSAIETYIGGPVIIKEVAEKLDGGEEIIFLRYRPVVEVVQLLEEGRTLAQDVDYYLYPQEGYIRKAYGRFSSKPQGVSITYKAGYAGTVDAVPWDIKQAALLWCDAVWNTGPANLTNLLLERGYWVRPEDIPAQVKALLEKYKKVWVSAV
ncbi:hypothetical protein SAMN00808754_2046 [Thermanaeromonas toyohensis ToBE]|uniref:Phage gp6-like head-tail connector protein n=1 Tax=Thermanaeromonas toyohensis ToBE TaxID=698762 RepID=A0A1W1VYN7_9FIRM|nr:hypothetical protein [Thermanaeromonas toyohensis]SMB97954.1 hypothetical protein SAMN00808754_2046 [Thermanaeromonas toyohensis ToBE]